MTNDTFRSYISDDFKGPLPWPAPKLAKSIWDNFSLKGKVAVITGGARGIGQAVADCYAQAGAQIAIVDYQIELATESAKKLAAEYGVKTAAYFVDVSKYEEVEKVMQLIETDFGNIDVFVANAGIIWVDGAILDETKNASGPDKWRRLIDVDLNAVYYCAKAVGHIFKAQKSGSFIITASMSGHIVNVPNYQTCYNVAKAGCLHLGKSLAVEWAGFARVNTVSPGYIDSGLSDVLPTEVRAKWWSLIPMGREGLPQELVGAYLYLASDASTYTTGSDIRVDGGYCSV
jgi:sorbose reductase